jgi:hypothetical protein
MKRLAARAPDLAIFSSGYVLRDSSGWEITDAGRVFLTSIETPATEHTLAAPEVQQPAVAAAVHPDQHAQPALSDVSSNVVHIAGARRRARPDENCR